MSDPLSLIQQRHSTPSRQLGEPGPAEAILHAILEAAIRVPDHGKLVPFRLICLQGDAKARFGEEVAAVAIRDRPDLSEGKREKELTRYTCPPLVLVVVARIETETKVPQMEQILSAGCVAHNLLLAAHAEGFGAQWLTGWAAYDVHVARILRLAANEQVIGFIHVGTPQIEVPDRDRPALADLVTTWMP